MRVYDYGEDAAGPFMALEWLHGGTLEERLARGAAAARRDVAHRQRASRRASRTSTSAASSTATSSRRTSSSTRKADRSSATSGWPAAWRVRAR